MSSMEYRGTNVQKAKMLMQRGIHDIVNGGNSDRGNYNNVFDVVAAIKNCGQQKDLREGIAQYYDIIKRGLIQKEIIVGNTLISMFGKCGASSRAQEVFDILPAPNLVSWNALISGHVQDGSNEKAVMCLERMQIECTSPNPVTYVCILKACGSIKVFDKGKQIHVYVILQSLLGKNIVVGNALIDMYAKCGFPSKAQDVFDQLNMHDVISWTALIGGYAQHGYDEEAMQCFEQMQSKGFTPNGLTYVCVLKSCGRWGAIDKGKIIHAEVEKEGFLEKDVFVGNALVDMYAKCGMLQDAQEVFDLIPFRDSVSWNALISGYVNSGDLKNARKLFEELPFQNIISWTVLIDGYAKYSQGREALGCFECMQNNGFLPNCVTFVCILKACGSIGAAAKGKEIHTKIHIQGLLQNNLLVSNVVIDMYARCGLLVQAENVFNQTPNRDVVSWNSLITGYAQQGMHGVVYNLFYKMMEEGAEPNAISFLAVLNLCSDSGLLDKGELYFEIMTDDYGIVPTVEHYACMIDLFGRAGRLDKAVALIQKVPNIDHLPIWTTLLGACGKWGNAKVARWCFEHAMRLEKNDAAPYVCMSNIYATMASMEGSG